MLDGKSLPKIIQLLERRNYEGKTAIMLAIEHERTQIALYLLTTYQSLDIEKKDSRDGNTPLHLACLKGNLEIAQKLYNDRPRLCLKQNY